MSSLREYCGRFAGLALVLVLVVGCGIAANGGAEPTVATTPQASLSPTL